MSIETFYVGNCQNGKDLQVYASGRMPRVEGLLEKRLRLWVRTQYAQMEHGTKKDFAAQINRTSGWVSKYLKKKAYATLDDVAAMAMYFKLPTHRLTGGEFPELSLMARQLAEKIVQLDPETQRLLRRRVDALLPEAPPEAVEQLAEQNPVEPPAKERRKRGTQQGA